MKHFLLVLTVLFSFVACGYKPSVQYVKAVLSENVYTQIEIDLRDPENAVFVKDALNQAVIERFGGRLVSQAQADSQLFIRLESVTFSPAQYDENGFVVAYNNTVSLKIHSIDKKRKEKTYHVSGHYDFPVEANSVISETSRFNAIKEASKKALNHFIARLSYEGYTREHK